MAILTRSGRAALAAAVKAQALHLALGSGDPDWDTVKTVVGTFTDDRLSLPNHPISGVAIKSPDGATTYNVNQDFTVAGSTGVITRVGTGLIAADATVSVTYTVDRAPEDPAATALRAEVGRRVMDEVAFVVSDSNGGIIAPTGRYTLSDAPTNHLFVRVVFDMADCPTATIREQGVFVATTTKAELPPGQRFFTPDQLDAPGIMLMIQHSVPLIRQPTTRETFEFVVTI